MKLIAPSILSADFSNLAQQVRLVELAGADWIHCDIMDGVFVPNISFGPMVVEALHRITHLPLDVHLMIQNPDFIIDRFIEAGAQYISVHAEEVVHLHRTISHLSSKNVHPGVVINPSTPVCLIEPILEFVDLVLVMTVNPGFGGQKFIQPCIKKIRQLADLKSKNGYNYLIEVDGGVNKDNIASLADAGCNVFVAGSSVFGADNVSASVAELKNLIFGR